MTFTSLNIVEIIDKLRSNKSVNDIIAILTYINGDVERINLLKTMDNSHHLELCQLLVDFIVKDDECRKNKDLSKIDQKAEQALNKFLKDMTMEVSFFEIASKIGKSKRLKIFKILKTLDDDVILRISEDSFAVKYLEDCLKAATPEAMEWLKPSACTDDVQLLLEAEEKSSTSFEDQLVLNCLDYFVRIYGLAINNSKFQIQQFHLLIFEKVITLTYMGHKKQRSYALKLLNRALRTYFEDYIREKHKKILDLYKISLQKHYCTRMLSLVKAKQSDWCYLWCFSLEIVGTDLFHGADLINDLLLVEEKAFKSNDMTIRQQAFISWKSLINIFASNPTHFIVPRRIKLLCIPLNSKNSKTETIAVTKLEVWWHLIVKLYPYLETFSNEVIFQFLNFCFGPLGETPLLSTKCELASAGKRFSKGRMYSVDALLQLLVADEKERNEVSLILDEKIPHAVTSSLFEENYKSFIHSVGEAVLIISNLDNQSEAKRLNLNKILWLSLIKYIRQANSDIKIKLNKELILVIGEIINHLEDSSLISNLFFIVILPELIKTPESFMHRDSTLIDLLTKMFLPNLLAKVEKKYWNDIKLLVCYGVKSENMTSYNPNVLILVKTLINQMQSAIKCQVNDCFIIELWCTLSESITKYISDKQKINESSTTFHNFETILALISFPLKNWCLNTSDQLLKIVKIWRDLYREFNMQADLITTVKFNEILNSVSETMSNCLLQVPKCYVFITHCLSTLMGTIHYGELLKQESIPATVILLRDVTSTALSSIKNGTEIEYSLKALSSFIITVYGLNQEKVLIYLGIINSTIENMLKIEAPETIQKEITNTWETVVLIFRGLSKILTFDFLNLYRETIKLGLFHVNTEIASETLSLLDIKKDLDIKPRTLLEDIESEAKKVISTKKTVREVKNDTVVNTSKSVKVVGSFFGRQLPNSKAVSTKKDKSKKLMPPPPEPDSQEYVVINNEIKVNVNLLTEHQKECFKQHKDDIPAMYNDLSQSGSCNTQELENWFKDKSTNSQTKAISVDNEANKENKNDTTTDLGSDKSSIMNHLLQSTSSNADKVNTDIQEIDKRQDEISPESGDSEIDKNSENNQVTENVAKKLNFESREEFPDDNNLANNTQNQLKGSKRRSARRIIYDIIGRHQNSEEPQLPRVRTRSSKLNDKISTELNATTTDNTKGVKRKASDDDSDKELTAKRRRHTIIPIDSNENQTQLRKTGSHDDITNSPEDPNLPKRTKKEISRLKIDMVFNSKMTSKLRSKPTDDYIYDTTIKRHSIDSKSRQKNIKMDKHEPTSEPNHELLSKRRRRDSKTVQQPKNESIEHSKGETDVPKRNEDCKESIDTEKDSDKNLSAKNKIDDKLTSHMKNDMEISSSPTEISTIITTDKQRTAQEDEVIESSQENSLIRNSLKKNDKKLIITNDKSDISPLPSARKKLPNPLLTTPTIQSSPFQNIKIHDPKESPSVGAVISNSLEPKILISKDMKYGNNDIVTYLSPKEKSRLKFKKYASNGRAAHMLNLVTKQAIGEKSKLGKLPAEAEEEKNEQEIAKEVNSTKEIDTPAMKKEFLGYIKESERVSSPIGHRQEKIFNNMKSGDCSSPPSKLFCNLKNDGEKISPKMEKSVKELNKLNDHDYTEMKEDSNIPFEKELPILEWSSANPPSLTASPSSSILKKHRQILLDSDIDTTPTHKRKRVSFADPPVSKKMGYEIVSDISPSKSKLGSSYSFPIRKGTPYRSRQFKWKTIEIPTSKQNDLFNGNEIDCQDQKDNDFTNISITLEEQFKDIEESIVDPMEVDFNFTDNSLHLIKGLDNNDNKLSNNVVIENQPDISIEVSTTQQDVFHEDEKIAPKQSDFKNKNDSTITKIINGSIEDEKTEHLEDTVDIQNISNLTVNSDDLENKSIKLDSPNVVVDNLAQCDTLPMTDSIFLSQGSIQSTPAFLQPEPVNKKNYIYPELLNCVTPIEIIIHSLVNPLWKKNLIKYFNAKHINTIGDLARLTEQEVIQIPINKSSKVSYVKKILDDFSKSSNSKQKSKNVKNSLEIVNETKESPSFNDSVNISSLTPSIQPSDNLNITEVLTNQTPDRVSGSYDSMILDTSISPPKKSSTQLINKINVSPVKKTSIGIATDSSLLVKTQAVETQVILEGLLDEFDGNLVLENVIKRNDKERVLEVLEMQSPSIKHEALERYLTPDYVVSYVKDKKIPKKDLLSIYEAISTHLPAEELIDMIAENLKKKILLRRTDDTNK